MSAIIVGVSSVPGIGFAVAKKFAQQGLVIGIVGRQAERLAHAKSEIEAAVSGAVVEALVADSTDAAAVSSAVEGFVMRNGPVSSLVYNASARPFPLETMDAVDAGRVEADFRVSVIGGLICSQAVLPHMRKAKTGSIIFTGATASLRGAPKFGSFCLAKSAMRSMAQTMAKELNPEGIHVAHVIVDGLVDLAKTEGFGSDTPKDRMLDTTEVAETFWHLHSQSPRCFTFEVDMRPMKAEW